MSAISPFFPDKDWTDVQKVIFRGLKRRHYRLGIANIEDITSATLLWLMGPWANTAPQDPSTAFKLAVRTGFKHASALVYKVIQTQMFEGSESPVGLNMRKQTDDEELAWEEMTFHTGMTSNRCESFVEEIVIGNYERKWASGIIDEYYQDHLTQVSQGHNPNTTEWSLWFSDLVSGVSGSDVARRENFHRSTISKRRSSGLQKLRLRAEAVLA